MGAPSLWNRLAGDLPPLHAPFLPPEQGPPSPGRARAMALALAYNGAGFAGWQIQARGRTIQGQVERELSRLCGHAVRLWAAGRTDAGVHAFGQVASFQTDSRLEEGRMAQALAAMLPPDIWLRRLGRAPEGFHARFDAAGKTYEYYLWPKARPGVFLDGLCWPLACDLDVEAMARGAAFLLGEVDLAAFAAHSSEVEGPTVRRISEATVTPAEGGMILVRLSGSGFLRHVVRNVVGTLTQIGQHRLEPEAVGRMLAAGRRIYPGPKAPPGGLYLGQIYY